MEDQKNTQANVIQFPNRKKEVAAPSKPQGQTPPPPLPKAAEMPVPKGNKRNLAATVLAVTLMTIAVNKYTFQKQEHSVDLSSSGRQIASVGALNFKRDAAWEMNLANELAAPQSRKVASTSVGRPATIEEKLRWGILEEKYTISYSEVSHEIHTILLQDLASRPAYILDRPAFLTEYGQLFEHTFDTAKLKSVEKSEDKTVESYTLFDKENKVKGEARFELDLHKRLISLKVEPVQI